MPQEGEQLDMRLHRTWHSIRHKPFLRNVCYGAFVILCIFVLRKTTLTGRHGMSESLTEQVTLDLPLHTWEEHAMQVQQAFLHAYHGYEQHAAPHDELTPLTNGHSDKFNGWGVSIFDSLDTMLIMDLKAEFERALPMIQKIKFSLPEKKFAPYFETVIRYLGGLLSAYALSHNKMLLDQADKLATVLDPVFNTTTGLALYGVNPISGEVSGPDVGILAEIASLQLEYTYLAKLTGNHSHFKRANTLLQVLESANLKHTAGMFPVRWNLTSGQPFDAHLSVGAQADSAHEYLLKQYLMTAKTDKASLKMYLRATTYIITNLLFLSPKRHLLYVTDHTVDGDGHRPRSNHVFEHLSCFLPGLLALGAHTLPLGDLDAMGINLTEIDAGRFGNARKNYEALAGYDLKKLHLWAAEGLAQTCWLTYADQPTGLGPDEIIMQTAEGKVWDEQGNQRRGKAGLLWMESMKAWKKSGSRSTPPGVGDKKRIIYTEKERLLGRRSDRDYTVKKAGYLLRPETVESLYILWRVTGNPKWRMRGRSIFQAIERETKTPSGYASLKSVEVSPAPFDDDMPSYFLAETLKYLYLMFINEDPLPLDQWVFNTEAHPFPVFEWTPSERQRFNI